MSAKGGKQTGNDDVAVIGMAGRWPGAGSVSRFWENLRGGKESIRAFSDDELRQAGVPEAQLRDGAYVKASPVLDDIDKFDPAFFKISPVEAELMDPQIRLLLQCAWETLEDAGYAGAGPQDVGVFAGSGGVTTSYFADFVNRNRRFEKVTTSPTHLGNDKDFLATYISYRLNLTGPSMTLQTACSTSLVAVHQACLSLRNGECGMAMAGGVTVRVPHIRGYQYREGYIFSKTGRITAFDEKADGVVFGSGLGMVLLKKLGDAVKDRDNIYAVVKGSAILNDGKGKMSYAASSARGQIRCVEQALARANVDPATIGFVEAHGTGTAMGDPEEVKALSAAFNSHMEKGKEKRGYCALGSVKNNVGHLDAAAGVTGFIKAVLCLQRGEIPPLAGFRKPNPRIKLETSPFLLNASLLRWDGEGKPRRAAVNSLGVGGTNAFVILEEHSPGKRKRNPSVGPAAPAAVPLSAKTAAGLRESARLLLEHLAAAEAAGKETDLADLAFTLQVGRAPMECRAAFVVRSPAELKESLAAYLTASPAARPTGQDGSARPAASGKDPRAPAGNLDAEQDPGVLADAWSRGQDVDWSRFHKEGGPCRISLPTYPFEKRRYWIETGYEDSAQGPSRLHPLVHRNTSDLDRQSYASVFDGGEPFLRDHLIEGRKVLPAVAYLEMVRAAIEKAMPGGRTPGHLEIRDTVWSQPLVVEEEREITVALATAAASAADARTRIDYAVQAREGTGEEVHCRGHAVFGDRQHPPAHDLAQLRERMGRGRVEAADFYAELGRRGLAYGPAHRAVAAILRGEGELVAQLRLPETAGPAGEDYLLHPSQMDGALQACVLLIEEGRRSPDRAPVPFALESLRIHSACTEEMAAWIRPAAGSRPGGSGKLDIDLCGPDGRVCVEFRGYTARMRGEEAGIGALLAFPAWLPAPVPSLADLPAPSHADAQGHARHHVILCGMPSMDMDALAARLPHAFCLQLPTQPDKHVAERYGDAALACLEHLQAILRDDADAGTGAFVQIAVADDEGEGSLFAGLSGMLKTASLENPLLGGQVILLEPTLEAGQLALRLLENRGRPQDTLIKYAQGERRVPHWEEMREIPPGPENPDMAFRDGGVYLITGGLGGLGRLFTREILKRAGGTTVVLTGRSEPTAEIRKTLDGLAAEAGGEGDAGRIVYLRLDLSDSVQVGHALASLREEHGRLDGILHAAGMISDSFLLKKDPEGFRRVLMPKVLGTCNLDAASRDFDLDFFALFSSVTSALGTVGQADYAAANGFMDAFALRRNRLAASRERRGRTVSIHWPLWRDGGMRLDAGGQDYLRRSTGMRPMRTATGLRAFYRCLETGHDQCLVMEGDLAAMRACLTGEPSRAESAPAATASAPAAGTGPSAASGLPDAESLGEPTRDFLRREVAAVLKMPSQQIDPQAPWEDFGIDSMLALNLVNRLEKTFGPLSKTLFFEHQTLRELAGYFLRMHADRLHALFQTYFQTHFQTHFQASPGAASGGNPPAALPSGHGAIPPAEALRLGRSRVSGQGAPAPAKLPGEAEPAFVHEPIAIVGLSGRYPEAEDIRQFGRNLRDGKDCIVEVPPERWDWREFFSEDRNAEGSHYSRFGGFIAGVDEFDPMFFNIPPIEAETMDPQERLFLQHAWMAVEDAGYSRAALQIPHASGLAGQVGVYAGVMYGEYQLLGAEASLRGRRMGFASNLASIANRASYVLNLHGPSLAVDTMCSSSLTAIHLACQDLKLGRTSLAIAGGVNVTIHPNKYLMLSAGQFISSDGHCQSFGEGGDGYIPGEGVGVVVLKRLSEARRDGNPIYGVIKGSALNHGGKTNGYTVPNPQAQAGVIGQALAEARVHPRHISYLEAHGTGTKLGDPIEIAALTQAFRRHTGDNGYCLIGSAKSNIGHCESAAGIAGLTKVLLQMRHRQIFPSLHSARLNPHIDFAKTPFVVNQTLRAWDRPRIDGREIPRLAGISSFGAGGSNAHLIVEEYAPEERLEAGRSGAVPGAAASAEAGHARLVPLSARTPEQLQRKVTDLWEHLQEAEGAVDLDALAYTLQVGREPLEERLGVLAGSVGELMERLRDFRDGERHGEGVYLGQVKRGADGMLLLNQDEDMQEAIGKWIARRKLGKLAELWVKGLDLDWHKLYGEARPRLLSLPAYPFSRERYWIEMKSPGSDPEGSPAARLHPLLHRNTSDFSRQSYAATFTGKESFLRDHQVRSESGASLKMLPAAAYLEMIRVAVEQAVSRVDSRVEEAGILELHDLAWLQPLVVDGRKEVTLALACEDDLRPGEAIEYEVYSREGTEELVHCQGQAVYRAPEPRPRLDLPALREATGRTTWTAARLYPAFSALGLDYGPGHRSLVAIRMGEGQLLAQLRLPASVAADANQYLLHPSLVDGALQACIGLVADLDSLPERPALPFSLRFLRFLAPCTAEMSAWCRYAQDSGKGDKVIRVDIDLCDAEGNVCAELREFAFRTFGDSPADSGSAAGESLPGLGVLLAAPQWLPWPPRAGEQASPEASPPADAPFAQHHVLLCGMAPEAAQRLAAALPQVRFFHPQAPGMRSEALLENQPENQPEIQPVSLAARYEAAALACFERLRTILADKPRERVLVQVVLQGAESGDEAASNSFSNTPLAGLSGLLATAAQENPLLVGQTLLIDAPMPGEDLAALLQENRDLTESALVKYRHGVRQVLQWREIAPARSASPIAFKEGGVYLITGGLGGLGLIFAKEILRQSRRAKVVLTGRSESTAKLRAILDPLSPDGQVSYRQLDVTDLEQARRLIASVTGEHGRLNGILHSAGMTRDNFILKKSPEEFRAVLAPKVLGATVLDEASRDIDLDFLVLFSSVAGVLGNPGQADYAAANGFLDGFAAYRNGLVSSGLRRGHTLSIAWPLWDEGGMRIDPAGVDLLRQTLGMHPLETRNGLDAFHRSLELGHGQALVAAGDLQRLRRKLRIGERNARFPAAFPHVSPLLPLEPALPREAAPEGAPLEEKTRDFLKSRLSDLLKIPSHQLEVKAPFENYGINSILAMTLTNRLEKTFGPLSKTLFFEYQSLHDLAEYFLATRREQLASLFAPAAINAPEAVRTPIEPAPRARPGAVPSGRLQRRRRLSVSSHAFVHEPIAIVGLSGRYPEAEDIRQFGRNLRDGKDCIVEVPPERWDWREFFSEDRHQGGRHYSKWGGFIAGVDEFDPRFFNISPREADAMDPQERLFLQHAWMAVEDAGYSRAALQIPHASGLAGQVGVYAGVMYGEYQLSGSLASIANRASYVLNLHGPSLTLDTMCSSSLTAIHLACQDLKLGRTSLAIAGGVNVTIHPNKYLMLSAGQFISSDGHCQSFGEGGDGYIPGEGVGVVVLKRLSEARRDGNPIYGVIKGSALNHGGKTNGYTVPNPQAQAGVIGQALAEARVHPRHISYLEAHGTGTKLGDPIEIAALTQAFRRHTGDNGYCLIGSAKSNIGHCESAAGIAGLTKVLLQMRHRQIFPSLHSARLNPHIDFAKTPFVVNQTLRAWDRPRIDGREIPRLAGISSFGAGGSNAHLIVEEYAPEERLEAGRSGAVPGAAASDASAASAESGHARLVPLSARTPEQLQRKVTDLWEHLQEAEGAVDLDALAYTLQVGREPLEERLGVLAGSVGELMERLRDFRDGERHGEGVYLGQVKRGADGMLLLNQDEDMQEAIGKWIARRKLGKLAELWVKGLDLDWHKLYGEARPRLLSLPAYPFARERYWQEETARGLAASGGSAHIDRGTGRLHPLLHRNTSDLMRHSYRSEFAGDEFFLRDHQVRSESGASLKMLPAAAYLEMIRAAVELAVFRLDSRLVSRPEETGILELHDLAWLQPLVVDGRKEVTLALACESDPSQDEPIDIEVQSREGAVEAVHCQGQAVYRAPEPRPRLDLPALREATGRTTWTAARLYPAFSALGLDYGPGHRSLVAIRMGEGQLLAQLRLPASVAADANQYLLHPSLVDGALQACIGLVADLDSLPERPALPFSLRFLRFLAPCTAEMSAWCRYAPDSGKGDKVIRVDIDLCDAEGNVCAELREFAFRTFGGSPADSGSAAGESLPGLGVLLAAPQWLPWPPRAGEQASPEAGPPADAPFAQHHVLLCGMAPEAAQRLAAALPQVRFFHPQAPGMRSEALLENQPENQPEIQPVSLAACYEAAALACFERLRTILADKPRERVLVQVVLQGAESGDEAASNSFSDTLSNTPLAGLSGLLATAAQENPLLAGQTLLIEARTLPEEVTALLLECRDRPGDTLVRLAGSERHVMRWREVDPGTAAPRTAFKEGGVYLITGGLGGLGLIFAKEILEQTRNARVVLTGRAEATAEVRSVLDRLPGNDRAGYRQLDVTDLHQARALLAAIQAEGPLHGILHSAGMTRDNFILKKSPEEFRAVLAPKVLGATVLDEASRDIDLNFLVFFSSVAGVLGNPGQADYAAANGFLDGFAAYRNGLVSSGLRRGHTLSIAWPLWDEGGMRIDPAGVDLLRQTLGMHPLETRSGLDAFHRSLALRQGRTLVAAGEMDRLRRKLLADGRETEAYQGEPEEDGTPPSPTGAREDDFSQERLVQELTRSLAETLRLKTGDIDENRPFVDLGLDSVVGVEWVRRVNNQYGIDMTVTKVYEHSTIRTLAHYLKRKFFRERTETTRGDAAAMAAMAAKAAKSAKALHAAQAPAARKTPTTAGPSRTRLAEPGRILSYSRRPPHFTAAKESSPFLTHGRSAEECRRQWLEAGEDSGFVLQWPAGSLDEIDFASWPLPEPEPGEITIQVMASALNFPDAMCVKGLYPTMPDYPFVPGFEVSGVVARVGGQVTRFRPGDAVIALTGKKMGGHASSANVPERNAVHKPGNVSFEEACSLPVVFATVQHAFETASLSAGESVLIHSATGGVGLMALQLAALRGAEAYATTSKQEKVRILERLGVRNILDYRTDFDREIRALTGGRGVDAVLNTLSGEGIQKGLNSLAPSGRYLEIAVHALKTSRKLDLSSLVRNQSFHSIDLRRLSTGEDADFSVQHLLSTLRDMVADGRIVPIVSRVYPVHQLADALEYVGQGRHIGKVVISRSAVSVSDRTEACLEGLLGQRRRAVEAAPAAARPASPAAPERRVQPIAVIGMAGQFSQAKDLEEFWRNIAEGRDCVGEVPHRRWDMGRYYQEGVPEPGKTVSKWMGALEEYDRFDPLFFNISPKEAESMDPQQRLFLQACWHSLEDAGYDARTLSGGKCGVFAGCGAGDYHRSAPERQLGAYGLMGGSPSILAARIAYFLNLQGPCLSIETACSSSLVAIAEACDSLIAGNSDLALAGGVYVMSGPAMHIMASNSGMLSRDGRCFTFDQRANGFVPGEGVGVVVLKRLSDARRDKDNILGVIQGWGINQDGKTNGITAPNGESQTRLQAEVYGKFAIDPAEIQLVEAHGTGTKLGDPIEVEGLKESFGRYTRNRGYCALGSVKSNIGHCMTAAGVAGLLKLLLAIRHRQLPPSINFERLNEHIDLENSPFYVNTRLKEWKVPESGRRQAAISSFGFSGTNAHLVVADYPDPAAGGEPSAPAAGGPVAVLLSARTPDRLRQKAADLLAFLRRSEPPDLGRLAYTLQVGREAMEERLGFVVVSLEELAGKLASFAEGKAEVTGAYRGKAERNQDSLSLFSGDKEMRKVVEGWLAERKLHKLLALWAKGLELDWGKLYGGARMPRIDLPKYPFAKDRYWQDTAGAVGAAGGMQAESAPLHPLLHSNTSTLARQSYGSVFGGQEFFLRDHQVSLDGVARQKILPAVAYLEMVRAAVERALPAPPDPSFLELRDVLWLRPIAVSGDQPVTLALSGGEPSTGGPAGGVADERAGQAVEFEFLTPGEGQELEHCRGRAVFLREAGPARLDLPRLEDRMRKGRWEADALYAAFARMGLHYGPGHRALAEVLRGEGQVLARLKLPSAIENTRGGFLLHPALLDAALQAALGLFENLDRLPDRPPLPFALASLRVFSACTDEMAAWVRYSPGTEGPLATLDVDLCDREGNLCARLQGFSSQVPDASPREDAEDGEGAAAFDESYYRQLIEDVINEQISIDKAVELG